MQKNEVILQTMEIVIGTEPKTKIHLCIFQCTYIIHNNFLVMMTFRVIPVPIPNTEVKPKCAENTCGLPCWEDRLSLDFLFYILLNNKRLEISILKILICDLFYIIRKFYTN